MKRNYFIYALSLSLFFGSCGEKAPESTETVHKEYTIEQFYKNEQVGGGAFSSDESKLLIHSNRSGIYNLYEISIADKKVTAKTSSKIESIFAIDYVPGTSQILYAADKGGNELDHIYLLLEDGSAQDLTPDVGAKASFYGWNNDKTAFFYTSNKRDEQFFDLYKMNIADWSSSLLYENKDGMEISGISWDEKTIALTKVITTTENQLFLYNTETNKSIELSQAEQPGKYDLSGFSKNGQECYYITDAGKEFAYLVKYNLSDASRTTLFETNWDVMYSYLSETEKFRVIGINEDGKNNLKIIDNTTGNNVEFPSVPDGDILAVNISASEKNMRLTVGTSTAPSNIYIYNFDSKELVKLTETLNPEINPSDLVSAEVVRYPSFDGLEIPAIYYKPKNADSTHKVPALVWVHGGPGGQSRVGYSSLIQYLTNHGYAVLAVNNRGSSGYGKSFYSMDDLNHGDKDLQDCIWGKKWLQSQNYVDADKIGIMGGSYGGYMTMAAMTFTPDEFKTGVNIFGVTNWLRTLKSIPPYWESFRTALYKEIGDPTTADSVRLYNISPLFHAHQVKNPVMVLQGANDPRVLQVESDEIVAAVKQNGIPVEYVVFPDEGHGFVKKENEIKAYGQILAFLDKYLKGEEVAATAESAADSSAN
jgi:dipeptidyl aminopeptidase/acylaminoacyl peptidase